jgi:hypothetical protein
VILAYDPMPPFDNEIPTSSSSSDGDGWTFSI